VSVVGLRERLKPRACIPNAQPLSLGAGSLGARFIVGRDARAS
jgi:hypothetical protein